MDPTLRVHEKKTYFGVFFFGVRVFYLFLFIFGEGM